MVQIDSGLLRNRGLTWDANDSQKTPHFRTLQVFVCVYIYIIYIYTYIHLFICLSIDLLIYPSIYLHTHTHTYIHTYIHTCIYIYIDKNQFFQKLSSKSCRALVARPRHVRWGRREDGGHATPGGALPTDGLPPGPTVIGTVARAARVYQRWSSKKGERMGRSIFGEHSEDFTWCKWLKAINMLESEDHGIFRWIKSPLNHH